MASGRTLEPERELLAVARCAILGIVVTSCTVGVIVRFPWLLLCDARLSVIGTASPSGLDGLAGWVADVIDVLGPVGVGALTLLETVFPPIPSEAVLPAAGYLAGLGRLSLWTTVLWSTVGSVVGALLLYAAGRALGAERMTRVGSRLPLVTGDDLERSWAAFDRWERWAVLLGRLVPGVRSLVSIPAGARRMRLLPFVALTALGSLAWNAALIGAGWWLGDAWGETETVSRWADRILIGAAVLAVTWFVVRRLRLRRVAPQSGPPGRA